MSFIQNAYQNIIDSKNKQIHTLETLNNKLHIQVQHHLFQTNHLNGKRRDLMVHHGSRRAKFEKEQDRMQLELERMKRVVTLGEIRQALQSDSYCWSTRIGYLLNPLVAFNAYESELPPIQTDVTLLKQTLQRQSVQKLLTLQRMIVIENQCLRYDEQVRMLMEDAQGQCEQVYMLTFEYEELEQIFQMDDQNTQNIGRDKPVIGGDIFDHLFQHSFIIELIENNHQQIWSLFEELQQIVMQINPNRMIEDVGMLCIRYQGLLQVNLKVNEFVQKFKCSDTCQYSQDSLQQLRNMFIMANNQYKGLQRMRQVEWGRYEAQRAVKNLELQGMQLVEERNRARQNLHSLIEQLLLAMRIETQQIQQMQQMLNQAHKQPIPQFEAPQFSMQQNEHQQYEKQIIESRVLWADMERDHEQRIQVLTEEIGWVGEQLKLTQERIAMTNIPLQDMKSTLVSHDVSILGSISIDISQDMARQSCRERRASMLLGVLEERNEQKSFNRRASQQSTKSSTTNTRDYQSEKENTLTIRVWKKHISAKTIRRQSISGPPESQSYLPRLMKCNQSTLEFFRRGKDDILVHDESIPINSLKDVNRTQVNQYTMLSLSVDRLQRIEILGKDKNIMDSIYEMIKI